MTSVRSALREGYVEITAPGITAVVEVADRHLDALTNAAADGVLPLLDLLCSRGLLVLPSFGLVATGGDTVRVLLHGPVTAVLADGRVLTSGGREPWSDADVADPGDEVVLTVPEPEPVVARGWRRPARLRAGAVAATEPATADPVVPEPEPEPVAEPERQAEQEPEPVAEPERQAEQGPEPAPPVAQGVPADLTLPPPEDASGSSPAERVPPSAPPQRSIIDSVPWRRAGAQPDARAEVPLPAPTPSTALYDAPPAPGSAPPVAEVPAEAAGPAEPAAVAEPPGVPVVDQGPPTAEVADRPEPVAAPPPPAEDAPVADVTTSRDALPRNDEDLDRPVVLAVLCPAGHHSPPHAGRCRTCGREIPPQQPTPIPRPQLGVLRISSGGSVPLDRGVLLGRAPRVNEELPAAQRPHLVRLGGDRDISRNHAEVVLEGWHVLVRDLGSTNGTTVALPGEEPVRLRPTEDQGIEPGTVITLADEVSLTYEVEG
ncbi:FHA domain-containing protein [Nostocoides sp. Soil756]|uniref:FHA domain-containing protein n=1 Tax=Nostocoides sp. Soil756 TaxID=1736399 RepID=UPI0007023998|nr:FHA domain-containing protein [Tetrasphaera sp. Soil756]KRE63585.1 hypothetical protein ASG78_01435 [Tetrasphaera sp. Soil756]